MLKKDARGIPGPAHKILYGVEVETELRYPYTVYDNNKWHAKGDPSLRGMFPVEFVSMRPQNRRATEADLRALWVSLREYEMVDTVRAATHLHVNMRGTSALYLANVLTMYYLVEDTVVKYGCGTGRFGNLFCLTGSQCYLTTELIRRMFEGGDMVYCRVNEDHYKYSALNLAALSKFGSLEFRALRTPTKSPDSILEIIALFSKLLVLARNYEHPSQIVSELSSQGAEKFVEFLLPKKIKENMEDPVDFEDIREGLLISQHIAYNSVEF